MTNLIEITKGWSETATTFTVGALVFLVPQVTQVDFKYGGLHIPLNSLTNVFGSFESAATGSQIILSLVFVCASLAVGTFVIQSGELIAFLGDLRTGNENARKRIKLASANAILTQIYQIAYSGFRLVCGLGSLLIWFGIFLVFDGIANLSPWVTFSGSLLMTTGLSGILFLARFTFVYVDWLLFEGNEK